MKKISLVAYALWFWVVNIVNYNRVYKRVKPLQDKLE